MSLHDSPSTHPDTSADARSLARGGTRGAAGEERLDAAELAAEETLRQRLQDDPNDQQAFQQLVDVIRSRALAEAQQTDGAQHSEAAPGLTGAVDMDPDRVSRDAIWAVAEELAGNPRAWFPLIELARLGVVDDREAALRRLGTAADRDPSGQALHRALQMLRNEGLHAEALSLGTGHWRPGEHHLHVGREMVETALLQGRTADARRAVEALAAHPDQAAASELAAELRPRLTAGSPPTAS